METLDEDIHPHCLGCINIKKCNVHPQKGFSCELVSCHLECGATFHECKKAEHRLLCQNEKVPCYNKENGCPCVMQRGQLSSHLAVCPASVVHCTMEWNRWHINEISEQKLQRCRESMQEQSQQPQLDIALALRDQRILKQWYSSSKNGQKALRNNFKKQPRNLLVIRAAEPYNNDISSGETSMAASSQNAAPPGLQRSVCSQLCQAYECYLNNFGITLLKRTDTNHVANNLDTYTSSDGYEENKENMINDAKNCLCAQLRSEILNPLSVNDTAMKCSDGVQNSDKEPVDHVNVEKVLRIKDDVFFDEHMVSAVTAYPTRYLGLDPSVEIPERSLIKEMYTFLCCQEFRRDEYPWHYKNVHSEIHGGLNGWIQERCPLAQYGCMFSRQRLNPMPKGSKVVYNDVLESFGVLPPSPECLSHPVSYELYSSRRHSRARTANLTELPYEVLRHLASFLDSFSLSNLSLTCSLMRDVCQSLLVERGIVTLRWERRKKGEVYKWEVANKRWCFSSHFSPIQNWSFDDSSSMSNHLKSCKYFERNRNMEPFHHLKGLISPNGPLYQKLTNSLSQLEHASGNITTKL